MLEYSYILMLAKAYATKAITICKARGDNADAEHWEDIVYEISEMQEMQRKNSHKEVTI